MKSTRLFRTRDLYILTKHPPTMSSPSDPQLQEEDKLSDILPDVSSRGVSLSDSRAVTPQPGTSSGARKASHLRKEIQNENNGGDVTREADDIDSEEEQREEEEEVDAMDVDQDEGVSRSSSWNLVKFVVSSSFHHSIFPVPFVVYLTRSVSYPLALEVAKSTDSYS